MASKRKTTTRANLGISAGGLKASAPAILPAKLPRSTRVRSVTREDMPEPYVPPDEHNVSMRKITGGHIIRQHGYKDGQRFEKEQFSTTKPTVQFGAAKRAARLAGKAI